MRQNKLSNRGFTIVELLVVIVIIGILAAITIVAYTGISQKAAIASLTSDLTSASTQLKLFQVSNGVYPTTIDCSQPDSATNKCIKSSSGNTFDYAVDNSVSPQTFKLTNTNVGNNVSYRITNDSLPVSVAIFSGWKTISVEHDHACGISIDLKAYCWGWGGNGGLGIGTFSNSSIPVAVDTSTVLNGKTIKSITVGRAYSCVVASDNLAYCWGSNSTGQFGNNSTTLTKIPTLAGNTGALAAKTILSIYAGFSHTCAIASDDLAYCWGNNSNGQLGNNSIVNSSVPVAVNTAGVLSGKTIKTIAMGEYHTCAIASDDKAYCWGYNYAGALGNNSIIDSSVPVAVDTSGVLSGKTIKSIDGGWYHTCAIASDNNVYCWGLNSSDGILGNNSTVNSPVPVAIYTSGALSGKTAVSISAGMYYTCIVASDSKPYCWGSGNYGVFGNNSSSGSPVPVATNTSGALNGQTMTSIYAGGYTCAISSSNKAYCWGSDDYGQLGNGLLIQSLVPVATAAP